MYVIEENGEVKPYGLVHVRRYFLPEQIASSFMVQLNDCLTYFRESENDTYAIEILTSKDPCCHSAEMSEAKKKEIKGLLERTISKIIRREEIPKDANILLGGFVLAIKSTEDGQIKYKARFFMGGHRDKHKYLMAYNAATLQHQFVRPLLALANAHNFKILITDITQAYIQSTDPLLRDIYMTKATPEFELAP